MNKYNFSLSSKRIWVAGHNGMVGSAIVRHLQSMDCKIITVERKDLDLTRQKDVESWIQKNKPDAIFIAAAKVGGIVANNTLPAEFLYQNMMIEANVIQSAHECDVDRILFLGSSCIYPRMAQQPMRENALLTGPLEPTNECYAIAKIAGIMLCQSYRKQYGRHYISAQPTNLFGPHDNFHLEHSHVIPALIQKAHYAKVNNEKSLEVWGSGMPLREFLYVDDLADALIFIMERYDDYEHINVGTGIEVSIKELAQSIAAAVGFTGELTFDSSRPDGAPRKLLDSTKLLEMGWKPKTSLLNGIKLAYQWYLETVT